MGFDPSQWEIVSGPAAPSAPVAAPQPTFDPSQWEVVSAPAQAPIARPDESWTGTINDLSGQALKGVVPGGSYLDAAATGAQEGLLNLFGASGHDNFTTAFNKRLAGVTAENARMEAAHPAASSIAQLGGAVLSPLNKLLPGLAGLSTVEKIAQGGLVGAGAGAAYGAGNEQIPASSKIDAALKSADIGALFGGGSTAAAEGLSAIGKKLAAAEPALDRKSIGARQGDYAKTANDLGINSLPETGDLSTLTKTAIDDLLAKGKLGTSRDPGKMLQAANAESDALSTQVGQTIAAYDQSGASAVIPDFARTEAFLAKGGVPANEASRYAAKLAALRGGISDTIGQIQTAQAAGGADAEALGGPLAYLQQQKIAAGAKWSVNDQTESKFWRSVYGDLQNAIEGAVPEVKPLNQELQKYFIVKPILQRGLAKGENAEPVTGLLQGMRTSGGVGTAALLGAFSGHPAAGALGGLALWAARTPQGLAKLADVVGGAGGAASGTGAAIEGIAPSVYGNAASIFAPSRSVFKSPTGLPNTQSGGTPPAPEAGASSPQTATTESTRSPAGRQTAPNSPKLSDVSYPTHTPAGAPMQPMDMLRTAVMHVESNGNPSAVSSKGAVGLMQIRPAAMRDVMRAVGVDDSRYTDAQLKKLALDPDTNKEYGGAYLEMLLKRFKGDPELALAAYNAGPTLVAHLLKASGGSGYADIKDMLPKETRAYLPKVDAAMSQLLKV